MHTQRMGATLFELLITLCLLGVVLSIGAPPMRTTMHAMAVRAARESVFGAFVRARAIALQQGGAGIELSAQQDRITVRSISGVIAYELLLGRQDVDLQVDGNIDPVILRYDAHGLGRMMSRTVTFAAGDARAGLTVSSFGRVRRW